MVSVKGWRREARNSSEKAESQVPLETQRWWLHMCCSTSLERPEDGKDSAFQSPRAASWCGRGDHFLACAHGGANRPASSHQGEPGQPTAVTGAGSGSEARGGVEGFTASSRTKGASEGKGGGSRPWVTSLDPSSRATQRQARSSELDAHEEVQISYKNTEKVSGLGAV